jgi:endoglucanase
MNFVSLTHRVWKRATLLGAATLAVIAAITVAFAGTSAAATSDPIAHADAGPIAHAAAQKQCDQQYPAQRDPSNPLDLSVAPGSDPLNGANFFVDGPAHGAAAQEIAHLLGLNPANLSSSESWNSFEDQFQSGHLTGRLAHHPGVAHEVDELSKIASQPEAQRFSIYSGGGGPGAIYSQVTKILCRNMQADPGTVPIINTYFLHPELGGCPTPAEVTAYNPVFHRRIDEMAAATGRHPAVYLLELDGLGSSSCVTKMGAMPEWEADLRYEINKMRALPHTVVYVEAGYSDSNTVRYTARILNAIGIQKIRGFFTNDTHENWTSKEVKWATKISKLTHGAHFIVNTSDNGQGPLLNKHPKTEGVEDLCNPPGRGLGPMDTTHTGFKYADGFLWTHPPGNSSGCGGGPPGGTFYTSRAVSEAVHANQQLGPGYHSRPY